MAKKNPKDKLFVEVVEAAVAFHARRLWNHVDSAHPISIRVEGEEHPLLCFVLGSAGQELGLSALRGEQALKAFEEIVITGGYLGRDAPCDLLLMSFEMPSEVNEEFLRPIQQSGRVFGRHSAAPVFLSMVAGMASRPMSRPELRVMLAIMKTLQAAATSGQLQQREWDWKRRTLELSLEGKGKKARVVDSVVTWAKPSGEDASEVRTPVLDQRWYDVTGAATRSDATWGIVLMPAPPVADDPRPREIVLAREASSGTMLDPKMVLEGDPDELASALLDLIESGPLQAGGPPGLPAEIRFMSARAARQMRPAFEEVSVAVTLEPRQPELMDAVAGVTEMLEASMRADGLLDEQEDETDQISPWKTADSRLSEYLVRAGSAKGAALKKRPLEQYFGDADEGLALAQDDDDPTPGIAYFNWFLFRYRVRKGARTVAERVRDERKLPKLQQSLLEARIDAKLVVGRIVAIDPGAWVELENADSGEVHRLHDFGLSKSTREGLGLILEIFPVKEWTFAMVAGPALPPMAIQDAMNHIEALGHDFEGGFLMGDRLYLGELFLEAAMPRPVMHNTDGEELEMLTVCFVLASGADISSVLSALPEMQDNGDDTWTWLTSGEGKAGFDGGVVLAHFEQVGQELLASVNSAPRAQRVERLLRSVPTLEYRTTSPTVEPEGGSTSIPAPLPPELKAGLEQFVHKQAMAWLDEPVPAFAGKTPRAAAMEPAFRKEVERMIRTYPDAGSPNGPIPMPRLEMLRELGLD